MKRENGSRYCDLSKEYAISSTQLRFICEKIERMMRWDNDLANFIKDGKVPDAPKYKMSIRTFRVLQANNLIDPVSGILFDRLKNMTEAELLRLHDCGKKTVREIKDLLAEGGMSLKGGREVIESPWPPDSHIYVYRMREVGYGWDEIATVFGVTSATARNRHFAVKELMKESALFNQYVLKKESQQ